ncbi:MAG TPA: GNAT family N-acetyltransferase [Cellvibrionaceae bacterium]
MIIRQAEEGDIDALVALVNSAYRPALNSAGWTHESALVEGDRVTSEHVRLALKQTCVLLAVDGTAVLGCVHVESKEDAAYLGMLAVRPDSQKLGLGKQLLHSAEQYAQQVLAATELALVVVSSRSELIGFYLRRGYSKTDTYLPYPVASGVGTPRQDIQLQVLRKACL